MLNLSNRYDYGFNFSREFFFSSEHGLRQTLFLDFCQCHFSLDSPLTPYIKGITFYKFLLQGPGFSGVQSQLMCMVPYPCSVLSVGIKRQGSWEMVAPSTLSTSSSLLVLGISLFLCALKRAFQIIVITSNSSLIIL